MDKSIPQNWLKLKRWSHINDVNTWSDGFPLAGVSTWRKENNKFKQVLEKMNEARLHVDSNVKNMEMKPILL